MTINLLNFFDQNKRQQALIGRLLMALVVLVISNFIAVNIFNWQYVVLVDVLIVAFGLGLYFSDAAFYLMLLTYPFIGWQFVWRDINVPYVDLFAMLAFLGFAYHLIKNWKHRSLSWKDFPGIVFIGAFVVSGILSLINAEFLAMSIKYLLRPIIFFYLMFVFVPFNLIENKSKLKIAIKFLIIAGLIVAAIGFLSIVLGGNTWFVNRAVPFNFGDFNPIGGNQNAVAEIMVITIPLMLILLSEEKSYRKQGWIIVGIAFLGMVLFYTLSRSGYLALLFELLIFAFVKIKPHISRSRFVILLVGFILLPLVFYFSVWQNISWVQGSNVSRIALSEISWGAFKQMPIIGHGVGSFMSIIGSTFVFVVEFGDPLDSHGFIQKIIVEQGALGLLSFGLFIVYIFAVMIRAFQSVHREKDKMYLLCFILLIAGITLFELFSTSYYLSRMWVPIGVALAGARLLKPDAVERVI